MLDDNAGVEHAGSCDVPQPAATPLPAFAADDWLARVLDGEELEPVRIFSVPLHFWTRTG